ncbi:2442_t:CDS:1, partial [Dentiscutata heterogama]
PSLCSGQSIILEPIEEANILLEKEKPINIWSETALSTME